MSGESRPNVHSKGADARGDRRRWRTDNGSPAGFKCWNFRAQVCLEAPKILGHIP